MKELLELRKKIKAKKPRFVRQEATKKKKLRNEGSWRRPKGLHSKVRLGKAGHEKMPSPGWGSPKAVKHLHKSGLRQILVRNSTDLEGLDPKKDGIILSSKTGKKKKLDLIKLTEEKGFRVLNIKDTKSFVEKIKKEREEKKNAKADKKADKEKKKAKPKKEVKPEEKKKEVEDSEEKKKEDKKEKDKILTKKS